MVCWMSAMAVPTKPFSERQTKGERKMFLYWCKLPSSSPCHQMTSDGYTYPSTFLLNTGSRHPRMRWHSHPQPNLQSIHP